MTTRTIEEIQAELETRVVAGSDVIQTEKLAGAAKRENIYEIGALLNELRELHPSDELFGQACARFFEEIAVTHPDRKIPKSRTTLDYRQLSEFGELWECELVGFTNVYKLATEAQADNRALIKGMLTEINPHELSDKTSSSKALSVSIKDTVKQLFKKPEKFSEEEVRELVESARGTTSNEQREAIRQEGATEVYYRILEIEPEDAEGNEQSLRALIKASIRKLSRKYHPDSNLDDPEKYASEFQLIQEIKEFFNV